MTRWLPVALAAALALPACDLRRDDPVDAPPPSPVAGAAAGGELRVGIVRPATVDPQLLDPADTAGALVVRTMCDPLIGTDPVTRELRPSLAKTWRVLGEGSSVQVEIRSGLRFPDGSELTARDVVATVQRVVDPATVSPATRLVKQVAGYADVQEDRTEPQSLAGVAAVSGDTVQITLARGDSQWVNALTLPFAVPVPRAAARTPGFSARPVCVGPYRLAADYTGAEDVIRLVRNDGYAGVRPSLTRAGAGWPDRVTFKVYASGARALAALRKGEVDAAQPPAAALPARDPLRTLSVPTGRLEYVGLPRQAPFDDPVVKAALSGALDRERLNAAAFRGTRVPAYNLLPVTLPDSLLPENRDARTCGVPPRGDVRIARELLARRGVDLSKTTVRFYVNAEFDNVAMAEELARQWRAAFGLTVRLRKEPFAALVARGKSAGGFDGMFRMAATADYPGTGDFVLPLVSREAFGTTNLTGYDGELVRRRLTQDAMKAIDPLDQRTEYFGIAAALCTVPLVPLAWYQSHLVLGPRVVVAGNGGVDAGAGLPELRELAVR